mgnify:CR=1 FL=1
MQKFSTLLLAAIVAVAASYITVTKFALRSETAPAAAEAKKETTYERVMRTKELHCGYLIYPPNFMIDVNSKKMSGIFYDAVEAMGKELNLKIVWQEEGAYDRTKYRPYRCDLFGPVGKPSQGSGCGFQRLLFLQRAGRICTRR